MSHPLRSAAQQLRSKVTHVQLRKLSSSRPLSQQFQSRAQYTTQQPNFYKSHGRALFKSLTMAFFSYQIFYWAWLTLENETMKDEKGREIRGLEEEVKMLSSGQGSHVLDGKRLVEENIEGKK